MRLFETNYRVVLGVTVLSFISPRSHKIRAKLPYYLLGDLSPIVDDSIIKYRDKKKRKIQHAFYLAEKLCGLQCKLDIHFDLKVFVKPFKQPHDVCVHVSWLVV